MSPQNPQSGAEELAIPEQKEAVDSVGNLADLVTEIKPPLEIKDEDRSKIEAAFGGQKIDKDTIVGLSYDEMVDAEKKENGSLSVLFGKKYDQEKGYTGMALKDKESYKEGDKVLVHFQGNETAYWEIGAGDMLPENVREVKISDSEGNSRIGKRKGLKCGFYDSKGYIPVFDNYTIEVTEVWDKEKMAQEKERLEKEEKAFREIQATSPAVLAKMEAPVDLKENLSVKETIEDHNGKKMDVEITEDTLKGAMAESSRGNSLDRVTKKPDMMKLINYVGFKVGVPNWMITTVLKHECSLRWPPSVGDGGRARGMGQHHAGSWATAKKHHVFHEVMSEFITGSPMETGRAQNILADILGAAITLKKGADLFDFELSHKTPKSYLAEVVPSPEGYQMTRLAWIRMYYHVPSYARYYHWVMTKGFNALSPGYQKSYRKAQAWMAKQVSVKWDGKRRNVSKWKAYDRYSHNAQIAHRAVERS
jgi:hypothetical protein